MSFTIAFDFPELEKKLSLKDNILMIGSCFTENMCKKLSDRKFNVLQNPHGIIFNPISVCKCLIDITQNRTYTNDHTFYLHELYHSWFHHSRFSDITPELVCEKINQSIAAAHTFLQQTNCLIITLGSAFAYRHNELDMHVSNNHRAPAQTFSKELLEVDFIVSNLQRCFDAIQKIAPAHFQIILTISPVRHLRDGVIENNKSKARLIESVHQLCAQNNYVHYFPSYEIVLDELRDYRFYDIDMAHPNYSATEYVWKRFLDKCIDTNIHPALQEINQITIAAQHRSLHPNSTAHQQFLKNSLIKIEQLQLQFPYLNFENELQYFKQHII